MIAYLVGWLAACALALTLAVVGRRRLTLLRPSYWRRLAAPWRLATFAAATVLLILVGPWSGDPTWDATSAGVMSVLAFATAPWVLGTLYRREHVFVALVVWMFSASWCYDGYVLLRDGVYPPSWASNIAASSVLYLAGGFLWSLEWVDGRGVIFAFMDKGWPETPPSARSGFRRVAGVAILFMALVTLTMLPIFLGWWR